MINRITFLFIFALLCGCDKPAQPAVLDHPPERIISLAPNITETLYALGLGDKLVGNTPHCTYPEAAREVQKVGSFGSFSYETIVSLKPDLVILHKEYEAEKARLKSLNFPTLETGSYFIADILEGIQRIGAACNVQERADKLIGQLERRITQLQSAHLNPPRVLITFGSASDGPIQAFGSACLHNELLEIAGGKNVIEGELPFATLSREAILRLNPDIIIVLAPELKNPDAASKQWEKFTSVNAVQHHRIHILTADYTCIPGPRFLRTLEDFAKIIRQND